MEKKKMNHDFDELRNLVIGTVESVSPSEIKVILDINAPQNTAINTGTPILFPKINGFLLIRSNLYSEQEESQKIMSIIRFL